MSWAFKKTPTGYRFINYKQGVSFEFTDDFLNNKVDINITGAGRSITLDGRTMYRLGCLLMRFGTWETTEWDEKVLNQPKTPIFTVQEEADEYTEE